MILIKKNNLEAHERIMKESWKSYKGGINNYVDKMKGEGVKICPFLSGLRV